MPADLRNMNSVVVALGLTGPILIDMDLQPRKRRVDTVRQMKQKRQYLNDSRAIARFVTIAGERW